MTTVKTFLAIQNFIKELHNVHQESIHALNLYHFLISKTDKKKRKAIKKHVKLFRNFCNKNSKNILEKNVDLKLKVIAYSDKVYLDFDVIFRKSDNTTTKAIWEHLLCIMNIINPNEKTLQLLKQSMNKTTNNSNESNFIDNIIQQVGQSVQGNNNGNKNPMNLLGSLMKGNLFKSMVSNMNSGVQSGELDLKRLLGTVKTLVDDLSEKLPDNINIPKDTLKQSINNENLVSSVTKTLDELNKMNCNSNSNSDNDNDNDKKSNNEQISQNEIIQLNDKLNGQVTQNEITQLNDKLNGQVSQTETTQLNDKLNGQVTQTETTPDNVNLS